MINVTRDQAERIAFGWIRQQENALDIYGGYPGELYVVRDMLVWFINSNGEKYDGPSVDIMTIDDALAKAENYLCDYDNEEDEDDQEKDSWRQYEAFFGESVQSLANYLMTAKGGSDSYSAGCPYKEDAPAVKNFIEHCKSSK